MSDNPKKKSYKEIHGITRVGSWLKGITGTVAPALLSAVGLGDLGTAMGLIKGGKSGLSERDAQEALRLIDLDYADLKDARDMQVKIATSKNSTTLAKNFIYYLASGVFIFSAILVFLLFFVEIPESNKDVVNFILGIIIGTGLSQIFQFFFGSSKGSKDKEDFMNVLKK